MRLAALRLGYDPEDAVRLMYEHDGNMLWAIHLMEQDTGKRLDAE